MNSSLEIALESGSFLLQGEREHVVVLGAEFVVVLLLEIRPFVLRLLLCLLSGKVVELLSHLTPFHELPHAAEVLLLHVWSVCGVFSLQEESKELEHGLFDAQVGVFESILAHLSEPSGDDRAESLFHESGRFLTALESKEVHWVFLRRHSDWQLLLVISSWSKEEALEFRLALERELRVLVLHHEKRVSFDYSVLVDQSHRAVAQESFLLGNDLGCLVGLEAKRDALV